jgi:uncharacterized protein (DUF4415 family)
MAETPDVDRAKLAATTEADIARHKREDDAAAERDARAYAEQKRRGRPAVADPKQSVTLRLDADVLHRLRRSGPGWQTRVNDALRAYLDEGQGA